MWTGAPAASLSRNGARGSGEHSVAGGGRGAGGGTERGPPGNIAWRRRPAPRAKLRRAAVPSVVGTGRATAPARIRGSRPGFDMGLGGGGPDPGGEPAGEIDIARDGHVDAVIGTRQLAFAAAGLHRQIG